MDITQFLKRINVLQEVSVSYESLSLLQYQFLQTIPFENLDIIRQKKLSLQLSDIYHKIVECKRGGICFENNALFCWALQEIGFDARIVRAEMFAGNAFRDHFDHAVIIVTFDKHEYLVDVGNGKYYGTPVLIQGEQECSAEDVNYRIMAYGEDFCLQYYEGDTWHIRHAFQLQAQSIDDFTEMCHFIETSPESAFTAKDLVTILSVTQDSEGRDEVKRVTLSGKQLSTKMNGQELESRTVDEHELEKTLAESFGVEGVVSKVFSEALH